MTTDPIEQARHSALIGASNAVVLGILAGDAYEPMIAYEQAILRYHPDVVRLVLAARRFDYEPDEVPAYDEIGGCVFCGGAPAEKPYGRPVAVGDHEPGCPWLGLRSALDPFKEVQE